MEPSDALHAFRSFRRSLYECLHRRADALFDLADALLSAHSAVPSPVHLSLQSSHRRGWGSLYAALTRDGSTPKPCGPARRHPLAESRASARLRRGRERVAPMRRGVQPRARLLLPPFPPLCRPAHRGRMGLPVHRPAQLRSRELDRPRGRARVRPAQDANEVAAEQIKALLGRSSEEGEAAPLFVFDAGYDPVKLQQGLEGQPVPDPRPLAGGAQLLRRPEPLRTARAHRTPASSRTEDEVLGSEHLARTLRRARMRGRRLRDRARAGVGGAAPEGRVPRRDGEAGVPCRSWSGRSCWWRSSGCPAARGVASRGCCGCGGHGPEGTDPDLGLLWRAYVRRFDLEHTFRFLKQNVGWTTPRVRHPEQADRWTWLVVAAYTQLRLARAGVADLRLPWERRYEAGRLTPVRVHRVVSALLGKLGTPAKPPKPCGRSPGRPKGTPLGPGEALPGHQEERLSPRRRRREGFCDDIKPIAKPFVVKTQA